MEFFAALLVFSIFFTFLLLERLLTAVKLTIHVYKWRNQDWCTPEMRSYQAYKKHLISIFKIHGII
jgi:hypothetical protein